MIRFALAGVNPNSAANRASLSLRSLIAPQHRVDAAHPVRERVPHRPLEPLPLQARMLANVDREHIPAHRGGIAIEVGTELVERLPLRSRRRLGQRYALRYAQLLEPLPLTRPTLTLSICPINPLRH